MDRQVVEALLKLISEGEVTRSNISRQSISEIDVVSRGHKICVTWYPPNQIRTLKFDGLDTPLHDRAASEVMRSMMRLAEEEFSRRASAIVSAAR